MPNQPVSTQDQIPDLQTEQTSEVGAPAITPPDFPDSPIINRPNNAVLWGFGITITYFTDTGLRSSPIASASKQLQVFWRTASAASWKVVTAVAQQLGEFPPVPHWDCANDNEVLIAKVYSFFGPEVGPAADRLFGCIVQYYYALQLAPEDSDSLLVANHPLLPTANIYIQPSQFLHNLIGPTTPPSGFQGGPINF